MFVCVAMYMSVCVYEHVYVCVCACVQSSAKAAIYRRNGETSVHRVAGPLTLIAPSAVPTRLHPPGLPHGLAPGPVSSDIRELLIRVQRARKHAGLPSEPCRHACPRFI